MPTTNTAWTDARTEMLKAMWKDGATCSQIARAIGGDLSRNAVISKVRRLGLEYRTEGVRYDLGHTTKLVRKPRPKRVIKDRLIDLKPKAAAVPVNTAGHPEPILLDGERITAVNARDIHCRYPHGDTGTSDFHYCGHPIAKRSWCAVHALRVYAMPAAAAAAE